MKVVHICLNGPFTDGFNYQENVITKYQKKAGYEVTLIVSDWAWGKEGRKEKCSKSNYYNDDGVKIIRLPVVKGTIDSKFKRYNDLYKSIEIEAPNIIFVHGCQFIDIDKVAKYMKKHEEVRLYVDNHSDYSNSATNWLSKNVLHKIIWGRCAHVIEPYTTKFYGVLPARVQFLEDLYKLPKEKCELLVMGADDEEVCKANKPEVIQTIRDKYKIDADDFLVVTGGKIDQWKKQTILLMKAIQNVNNAKIKLLVFGSVIPELKDEIEELADGKKIQYIGWVTVQESYPIFAAANIAVFPGRHSVFWEQVAGQGIPMIVKDWQGTHHVDLGGNVRFLYEDSEIEIQKIIEDIFYNREKYEEMKKVAMEKGKVYFSYSEIAQRSIAER